MHLKVIQEKIRDRDGKLTHFLTGRRFVFINAPLKPLGKSVKIRGFTARLYHKEQLKDKREAECTRCLACGHRVWQCVNDIVCRQCRTCGHRMGDSVCAALAGNHQPETTMEGSEGNQPVETTDSQDRFTWKEIQRDPLTDDMTSDDEAGDEGGKDDWVSATNETEPPLDSRQSNPPKSKSKATISPVRG